jgi:hemerythrin-like domain-containing protein
MHTDHRGDHDVDRRMFVATVGTAGAGLWIPAFAAENGGGGAGGQGKEKKSEEEEVSPAEDLMREHGVLKRVLLVYEEAIRRIDAKQDLPPDAVKDSAGIVRAFIEDYHEKLEEDYLFPRFEKARQLTDLTSVLKAQHQAGRRVTDRIMQLATAQTMKDSQAAGSLRDLLRQFSRMYAAHEAREDTMLFPAFRKLVSGEEYGALGEEFEKKEHALFGEGGFDKMVDRVAAIEKRLGIYELSQFTPKV